MAKDHIQIFHKISNSLSLNMDIENDEFRKKYTLISLQRGKLFKWVTFFVCFFSLYLDLVLNRDSSVDLLYRQILMSIHLVGLVLSLVYITVYHALEKSQRYRFSPITKAVIISDIFLTLLAGAMLSINSQRFVGNTDAYIMAVFVVALVIPMYPKWVLGIYAFIHLFFLTVLSLFYQSNTVMIRQGNSTFIMLVALVIFLVLYKYNIKNFLYEERLKEDKAEIKRMEQELTRHANVDCLTSVFNRRAGMELISKKYERAKQEEIGFTICFIDMDNLKTVNDTFGHLEGDSFIIEVCKILKEEIQPDDLIFRYGGDEFMILFDNDAEGEIDSVCRRITGRFEALNKNNYKPYSINATMGTFSYKPEMGLSLAQIIEIVDRNMYHNKLNKNRQDRLNKSI